MGPQPVRGAEFYGGPDRGEDAEILPSARRGGLRSRKKRQRKKDEESDSGKLQPGSCAGAERVDQKNKEEDDAEEPTGGSSGNGDDAV
jgi:hypothetical protein